MWLTALILGFAGSLHCLGMCAPLVMSVTSLSRSAMVSRIVYNGGRLFTYGSLGAAASTLGSALPLHNFRNLVSVALGITLLLVGMGMVRSLRVPLLTAAIQRATSWIKARFAAFLTVRTRSAVFVLGALNGLLPCGLTLLALTWCLTLQGPVDGFNFMILFGAGTLPAMLGLTSLAAPAIRRSTWSYYKLSTLMLIVSGLLLIGRVFILHGGKANHPPHDLIEIVVCE